MVKRRISLNGAVLVFFLIFPTTAFSLEVKISDKPLTSPEDGVYVGSVSCKDCHTTHYSKWFLSPHAQAYRSLKQKPDSPRCLRCHCTGFTGRYNPALAGVQCEACHGPSSRHVASASDPSPQPTPGLQPGCRDCEVRKICMPCHNQKESPDFDFKTYYERIRH